jgi:hypothetical protein
MSKILVEKTQGIRVLVQLKHIERVLELKEIRL